MKVVRSPFSCVRVYGAATDGFGGNIFEGFWSDVDRGSLDLLALAGATSDISSRTWATAI